MLSLKYVFNKSFVQSELNKKLIVKPVESFMSSLVVFRCSSHEKFWGKNFVMVISHAVPLHFNFEEIFKRIHYQSGVHKKIKLYIGNVKFKLINIW